MPVPEPKNMREIPPEPAKKCPGKREGRQIAGRAVRCRRSKPLRRPTDVRMDQVHQAGNFAAKDLEMVNISCVLRSPYPARYLAPFSTGLVSLGLRRQRHKNLHFALAAKLKPLALFGLSVTGDLHHLGCAVTPHLDFVGDALHHK